MSLIRGLLNPDMEINNKILLSPYLSDKVVPSKKYKIEEDEEKNQVKEEIHPNEDYETSPDGFEMTRKKVPVHIRVGDIFHLAQLDKDHQPGNTDFMRRTVPFVRETDPIIISRRAKQIEYGKSTPEYVDYANAIPREEREPHHPRSPNMYRKYSRRGWDGLVRLWRCNLHLWNKSPEEISAHNALIRHQQRDRHNESFSSSAGDTTSTASSLVGEGEAKPDLDSLDIDTKVSVASWVNGNRKASPLPSPPIVKAEKSWYEETLEFEEEYLQIHAPKDELDVNVKM